MRRHLLPLLSALVAVVAACGSTDTTLTVLAASSLSDAFEVIARDFEEAHPGVDVRLSAAGSQQLATQVLEGAPADVFASADHQQMLRVVAEGLAADPVVVAHNELAIAVRPGATDLQSVEDLADPAARVVLAAPDVPAGQYARQLLDDLGVEVDPVSLEPSVRAVLAKVSLGEADAGIVYRSDLVAAGADHTEVEIPDGATAPAEYPVAVLTDAPHPDLAAAFVDHLQGPAAQAHLRRLGFVVDDPPTLDVAPPAHGPTTP